MIQIKVQAIGRIAEQAAKGSSRNDLVGTCSPRSEYLEISRHWAVYSIPSRICTRQASFCRVNLI